MFSELAEEAVACVEKINWNKVSICSFLEVLLDPERRNFPASCLPLPSPEIEQL